SYADRELAILVASSSSGHIRQISLIVLNNDIAERIDCNYLCWFDPTPTPCVSDCFHYIDHAAFILNVPQFFLGFVKNLVGLSLSFDVAGVHAPIQFSSRGQQAEASPASPVHQVPGFRGTTLREGLEWRDLSTWLRPL